jgi:hypothetical protein
MLSGLFNFLTKNLTLLTAPPGDKPQPLALMRIPAFQEAYKGYQLTRSGQPTDTQARNIADALLDAEGHTGGHAREAR